MNLMQSAEQHIGVLAWSIAGGAAGYLGLRWIDRVIDNPAVLVDPSVIGSGLGAAFPVVIAIATGAVRSRSDRRKAIFDALRRVRSVRDAIRRFRSAANEQLDFRLQEMNAAIERIGDELSDRNVTDVALRDAYNDIIRAYETERPQLEIEVLTKGNPGPYALRGTVGDEQLRRLEERVQTVIKAYRSERAQPGSLD